MLVFILRWKCYKHFRANNKYCFRICWCAFQVILYNGWPGLLTSVNGLYAVGSFLKLSRGHVLWTGLALWHGNFYNTFLWSLQGATRGGPDWLWTYNGMLYLNAFGHGGCSNQSSVNLTTRYRCCQLLPSRLCQSAQDDDERGDGPTVLLLCGVPIPMMDYVSC